MSEHESHDVQSSETSSQTPLDAILAHEPASTTAQTAEQPAERESDDGDMVPLGALRRVRERQRKDAARVRELEEEIAKYNEERWGFADEPTSQQQANESDRPDVDAKVAAYDQSFARFRSKHGEARVAELDGALKQLNPQQHAHVLDLVGSGDGDPVERVQQYIEQLGLLFKPASLTDVLSGKAQEPPAPDNNRDAELSQREQAIMAAERRTTFNASRTDFVSQHGKAMYDEIDAASAAFANSNHPQAAEFAQIIATHPDPVGMAAHLLVNLGWSPSAPEPALRPAPVMPSNFTGVRSVGARRGPAWTGPTPLGDIFKRSA